MKKKKHGWLSEAFTSNFNMIKQKKRSIFLLLANKSDYSKGRLKLDSTRAYFSQSRLLTPLILYDTASFRVKYNKVTIFSMLKNNMKKYSTYNLRLMQ